MAYEGRRHADAAQSHAWDFGADRLLRNVRAGLVVIQRHGS